MSRSHKLTVPTARPPATARKILYLWGRGAMGAALQAYLKHSGSTVEADNEVARDLATAHGCPIGLVKETWAARVDGAESHEIDALTRDDPAVMGWTGNPRETCAPSVALRNALNAVTAEEYAEIRAALVKRFGRAGDRRNDQSHERLVAADDRIVYFDAEHSQWRLGEYAGT